MMIIIKTINYLKKISTSIKFNTNSIIILKKKLEKLTKKNCSTREIFCIFLAHSAFVSSHQLLATREKTFKVLVLKLYLFRNLQKLFISQKKRNIKKAKKKKISIFEEANVNK